MATKTLKTNGPMGLFLEQLIGQQLLSQEKALEAASELAQHKDSVILRLIEKGYIDPQKAAIAGSHYFDLPLYDINTHESSLIPIDFLDLDIVKKFLGLPILQKANQLVVAVADPSAPELRHLGLASSQLGEAAFSKGLEISLVLVEADKLRVLIEELLESNIGEIEEPAPELADIEISSYEEEEQLATQNITEIDANDTPVVRFVNKMLLDAIKSKSSDIHFEPYERHFRVRFRQDGILHEVANPPPRMANFIIARLKVLSNLDISERRIPQDGRFKISIARGKAVDFRISTCPTMHGEKVVIRILDSSSSTLDIAKLGMDEFQQKQYLEAIHHSQGMILVTGPTGSGKTVSLYTALSILNTPDVNISTIEDPVEIYLAGINQVQVNVKTGMTFASALRSFLRQDPDIIMVGEIRDLETADIAIKAAQTGHMVLSTLHTNSAPATIARLINMGVREYNIASSVTLVMAQRLVRQLCSACREPIDLPQHVLLSEGFTEKDIAEGFIVYKARGCNQCSLGYKGRTGIYEVMPVSEAMAQLIMEGGNAIQIAHLARQEGIFNLRESGLAKVKLGLTTLDEINRVITV